jgi:dTDP-4-dehydrorhamnose reductase
MKVLIFGGSGMLGHKLYQVLSRKSDTYVTVRKNVNYCEKYSLFNPKYTIMDVSVENFNSIVDAIDKSQPEVVVNCIGIVKQSNLVNNPIASISVNSLFPHQLAELCLSKGIRVIQISTDCVFSGNKGNYNEDDIPDATDIYGRTKYLGELNNEGCLTIRTSMIGRELATSHGLLEWFLRQRGKTVSGYSNAIFSGLTTDCLSDVIAMIISKNKELSGVWHIASEPINKYDLLTLIRKIYGLGTEIKRDETVVYNRSLDCSRFREETGFVAPSWVEMIDRMYRGCL